KTSLLSPDPSPPPVREAREVKSIAPPEPGAGVSLQGEELEFESKGSFPEAQDGARSRAAPFAPTGEQALKAGGTEAKAAPSPFRTELQERILEQVIEKATLSINGGKREVSLRLEPETLGVVRIQMRLEEGVLSARLMAESHAVKEALEAGLPRLRETLAQQGLSLEHLRVDVGDGRGSPMLFPWEGNGQGKPGVEGEDQVFEPRESQGEEDPYSPLSPESGRINIFI
ncbi:MAG: flagellar hook-length control protein FliK, partial [Nitrospinota bacterium]